MAQATVLLPSVGEVNRNNTWKWQTRRTSRHVPLSTPAILLAPTTMEQYKQLKDIDDPAAQHLATDFVPGISKSFSYSKSTMAHVQDTSDDQYLAKPGLRSYWKRRHTLFSRFDQGIQLDEEGLYSVTPEELARHQAARCRPGSYILDGFTGVGGNAIQFALMDHYVVAIDIDPDKIRCAKNNAKIYGVEQNIDFRVGDFFQLAPSLYADVVFLSPPWGGLHYKRIGSYDLMTMLQPKDGKSLLNMARKIAPVVVMYLPRNVRVTQLQQMSGGMHCEAELNFVDGRPTGVTVYYRPSSAK